MKLRISFLIGLVLVVGGLLVSLAPLFASSYIEPEATWPNGPIEQPINSGGGVQRKLGDFGVKLRTILRCTPKLGGGWTCTYDDWPTTLCLNAPVDPIEGSLWIGDRANPIDPYLEYCVQSWSEAAARIGGPFVTLFQNEIADPTNPRSYQLDPAKPGFALVQANQGKRYTTLLDTNTRPGAYALYAYDGGSTARDALWASGNFVIQPAGGRDSRLYLNGKYITDWSDLGSIPSYWQLNPASPQSGGVSLSQTGFFGGAIAGNQPANIQFTCGDQFCNPATENSTNCPADCATLTKLTDAACPNGKCMQIDRGYWDNRIRLTFSSLTPSTDNTCVLITRSDFTAKTFTPQTGVKYKPGRTVRGVKIIDYKCFPYQAAARSVWFPDYGALSEINYYYNAFIANSELRYSTPVAPLAAQYPVQSCNLGEKICSGGVNVGITCINAVDCPGGSCIACPSRTAILAPNFTGNCSAQGVTSSDGLIKCGIPYNGGACSAVYLTPDATAVPAIPLTTVTLTGAGTWDAVECPSGTCVMSRSRLPMLTCDGEIEV